MTPLLARLGCVVGHADTYFKRGKNSVSVEAKGGGGYTCMTVIISECDTMSQDKRHNVSTTSRGLWTLCWVPVVPPPYTYRWFYSNCIINLPHSFIALHVLGLPKISVGVSSPPQIAIVVKMHFFWGGAAS